MYGLLQHTPKKQVQLVQVPVQTLHQQISNPLVPEPRPHFILVFTVPPIRGVGRYPVVPTPLDVYTDEVQAHGVQVLCEQVLLHFPGEGGVHLLNRGPQQTPHQVVKPTVAQELRPGVGEV